jgi:hypothetical protein
MHAVPQSNVYTGVPSIRERLRMNVPFLQHIPDAIYYQLDETAFVLPTHAITKDRIELEHRLGHYVMTYNRNVFDLSTSLESHLCSWIRPADLNKQQLHVLDDYERGYIDQGVSLVVYHKPLVFMHPSQSRIGALYRRMADISSSDKRGSRRTRADITLGSK